MSRKSRRPEPSATSGRRGKHAAAPAGPGAVLAAVPAAPAWGAPFEVVLAVAVLLASPSLLAFISGEMPFDAAAVRLLAALVVAWVLSSLVVVVFRAVSPPSGTDPTSPADPDPLTGVPFPPTRP